MWMYSDDFGEYPTPDKWCDLLLEHGNVSEERFKCPGNKGQRCSFAINPEAKRNAPGDVVVLFETKGGWNQVGGVELLTSDNHEGWGLNALFNDGHVEFVRAEIVDDLNWNVEDRNFRWAKNDEDLKYWLENMVWYHQFSNGEIRAATGLTEKEIEAAKRRFDIWPDNRPKRAKDLPILVLPYPGGRHPRIGFLEGAIDPQRETKFSIFTPWDANSYVVVDVPEAIWSNLGLTYLAHTHIDTIWAKQGIALERLEWNRRPDGGLDIRRKLPNGIEFAVAVTPTRDAVLMEMRLANGTGEKLTDLRIQNCVMTKMAKGFEQQANENKVLKDPYAACRSADGKRWIVTAWQGCHRTWANEKCPCFHSDPKFPDLEPGQEATLKGWLSFYEGTDIEAEFSRIEETGWREK
jgi:prepilin-type processing-associated H-X9-DG protein